MAAATSFAVARQWPPLLAAATRNAPKLLTMRVAAVLLTATSNNLANMWRTESELW